MSKFSIIPKIAPSILSADFTCLGQEITDLTQAGADWIHCDVMDGHFVPNLTFGPLIIQAIRPFTPLPLDVHLMIRPVDLFIEPFAQAGADYITIHPDASLDPLHDLQKIRSLGKKAGAALSPNISTEILLPMLEYLDLILVMTVHPGFGGQSFMPSQLNKIEEIRTLIDTHGLNIELSVDGGITPQNAPSVLECGASVLVAGTSIFSKGKSHYQTAIDSLRNPI